MMDARPETVLDAGAQLRHTGRFMRAAADDLRHSPAVAWQLFRSNLQSRHRRAVLRYAWLLLPTLATTFVWVYLQSRAIVGVGPTAVPYAVYVLAGMTFWQLFVDALNAPQQQLASARQLITRSRLPHEALLLAGVYDVLLNTAVRLALLACALVVFRVHVAPTAWLLPFGLAALLALGLAFGIAAAPVGLLYDDVGRSLALITTFAFFLTPVVYRSPAGTLVRFNPVTPLLETARGWLTGAPAADHFAAVGAVSLLALVAAWAFERLARPHVIARLG